MGQSKLKLSEVAAIVLILSLALSIVCVVTHFFYAFSFPWVAWCVLGCGAIVTFWSEMIVVRDPSDGPPQKVQDRILNCSEALMDEKIVGIERAWALYERGRAFIGVKDDQAAVADFTDSMKLNPTAVPVYNDRGVALRHLGKFEEAIADFDAVIEKEPDHAAAHANRGVVYDQSGRTSQAIGDVSKAIEIAPEVASYWQERGSYRTRLKNWNGALSDFNKSIELDASNAQTFNKRGYCRLKRGDAELALKDFNEAIRLNPDYELAKKGRDEAEAALKN